MLCTTGPRYLCYDNRSYTGTAVIRTLIFPLMIKSRINTTNMQNHMPTIQKLQQRVMEARMTGNQYDSEFLSRKHLRSKVTPDFHLTYIVKTGEIWSWY